VLDRYWAERVSSARIFRTSVRRRALRSDGLFCFSVEAAREGDFVLRPTLRYAHSIAYC
jgi:predicted TPR repeat methyltransferase